MHRDNVPSVDNSGVMELKQTGKETNTEQYFDEKEQQVKAITTKRKYQPLKFKVERSGKVLQCDIEKPRHSGDPQKDIWAWWEYVMSQLTPLIIVLPDETVGIGDEWTTGSEKSQKVLGRATGTISFARTNKMGELEGGPPSEKDIFFYLYQHTDDSAGIGSTGLVRAYDGSRLAGFNF